MTSRNPRIDVEVRMRDRLTRGMKRATKSIQGFGKSLRGIGRSITENVTLPMGAMILAVRELGNQIERQAIAENFETTAKKFGFSADSMIKALDGAAAGTIAANDLMQRASEAMALGVATDLQTITELMTIARNQARIMGISTQEAFRRLVLGVGKAEKEIIEETGILFNANQAFKEYGLTIGKTAQQLTQAEKTLAILNQVLVKGRENLEGMNISVRNQTEEWAAATAQFSNAKDELVQDLLPALTSFLKLINSIPKPVLKLMIAMLAFAVILGPILQTISLLIIAIPALISGLITAIPVIIAVTLAMGPWLLVIGAVILAVATLAIMWKKNMFGIRQVTQRVVNFVVAKLNQALKILKFIIPVLGLLDIGLRLAGKGGLKIPEINIPGAGAAPPSSQAAGAGGVTNNINIPENSLLVLDDDASMSRFSDMVGNAMGDQSRGMTPRFP